MLKKELFPCNIIRKFDKNKINILAKKRGTDGIIYYIFEIRKI